MAPPSEFIGVGFAYAIDVAERNLTGRMSLPLGRVAGVPIGLHISWIVIAAIITLSLSAHFTATQPEWVRSTVWGIAVLTAVLFFISLLAHELAHALVARAQGIPVHSITLFALGGIARIEKEASSARNEFLMAIVGPLTSLAIGFAALGAATAMGWSPAGRSDSILGAVLGWLGSINVLLAAFNVIPAFPLDGGRVLRALLWAIYGSAGRATRHAAVVGQVVSVGFIVLGAYNFFVGGGFSGLWLVLIGWFLLSSAHAEYAQLSILQLLKDVRVAEVMSRDCIRVDRAANVQTVVNEHLLRTGRRCVVVEQQGEIAGLISLRDLRDVPRDTWTGLSAGEVMRPVARLTTVPPETPLSDAFEMMARRDVNQLPVVSDGHVLGVLSRADVLGVLESRAQFVR